MAGENAGKAWQAGGGGRVNKRHKQKPAWHAQNGKCPCYKEDHHHYLQENVKEKLGEREECCVHGRVCMRAHGKAKQTE